MPQPRLFPVEDIVGIDSDCLQNILELTFIDDGISSHSPLDLPNFGLGANFG